MGMQLYYLIENFKSIGFLFDFDDRILSFQYIVTNIPYIASGFIFTYFWSNYGPQNTFKIITLGVILQNIFVVIGGKQSWFFIMAINISRLVIGNLYMFNDFICYDYFTPSVGVHFSRYFSAGYLFGAFLAAFVNFTLFNPNFVKNSFIFFLFSDILLIYI